MKIYIIFFLIILVTVGLNIAGQKFFKQRWNFWIGYGIPALSMMLFLVKVSQPPRYDWWFFDFLVYYSAGHTIIQNPIELYNNPYNSFVSGFVNIPIIALLFTPFAALNKATAITLFTLLGGLLILTTCYFLVKLTKVFGWKRIAILGIFVANGPLYHSFWYGNLTHFVLLLLVLAWFCLEKQREFWLGVLLAVAALIKVPLLLLGVYFTLRKRWKVTAGFCAALLIIVGASVLVFGGELHLSWFGHIQQYSVKPISAYNVQSVDGFLARLIYSGRLDNWSPMEISWKFKIVRYALLSILVGTTIWICWRSKPPKTLEVENLEFCIVLCLALVISPISWTHYYLYLLLPFALYLGNRLAVPQGRLWSSLMVASIFLTSLPVFVAELTNSVLKPLYSRLLISHYFLGGVLLLGVLLAARWHTSKRAEYLESNERWGHSA